MAASTTTAASATSTIDMMIHRAIVLCFIIQFCAAIGKHAVQASIIMHEKILISVVEMRVQNVVIKYHKIL